MIEDGDNIVKAQFGGAKRPDNPSTYTTGPSIVQITNDLATDVAACEGVLMNTDTFQRAGRVVMRSTGKRKAHDGTEVMDKSIGKHSMDSFRVVLSQAATFEKYNATKKKYVSIYPPSDLVSAVLANPSKPYRILRGVICAPTLRADGSLLTKPGYDEASGLFFDPQGIDFGDIPEFPTKEDAEAALKDLEELIIHFPFVGSSKVVAIARWLTGLIAQTVEYSPMFLYTAPKPRTGKSKLNDMGSVLSHGYRAPVIGASSDPKELDKALAAALISGASQITLDNLSEGETLHSDLLSQCLTQEIIIIRKSGKNDEEYRISGAPSEQKQLGFSLTRRVSTQTASPCRAKCECSR